MSIAIGQCLFTKIDEFLNKGGQSEINDKEVLLLLGSAGSGKSIALQLKFIEAVKEWKEGVPLPVYFNLAQNSDLKSVINKFNSTLGTNLQLDNIKGAHLYIDSFDEGIGIEEKREGLIKLYLQEVKGAKILISCRTEYLPSDNDFSWFTPESKKFDALFVAPVNYGGDKRLEESVEKFIDWANSRKSKSIASIKDLDEQSPLKEDNYGGKKEAKLDKSYASKEEYLATIARLGIKDLIDTGFMFNIVMKTLPELEQNATLKNTGNNSSLKTRLTKNDIYKAYVDLYIKEGILKMQGAQQISKMKELIDNFAPQDKQNSIQISKAGGKVNELSKVDSEVDSDLTSKITELGKYLATNMHLREFVRIKSDSDLFKALNYRDDKTFDKQTAFHLLKLLPLKIESRSSVDHKYKLQQDIEIGFIHDTVKNYYLLESIKDEIKLHGNSRILAAKTIVEDVELIRFILTGIGNNEEVKSYLRKAIDLTKTDKSHDAVTLAANAITLLVASGYSFYGADLQNIAIKGANIRNGIFVNVDLSGADMSEVNMTNVKLIGAKLHGAVTQGVKLSILPDLPGHTKEVKSVAFSPDGKYVISGSWDCTVKIWERDSGDKLAALNGHTREVNSVAFSPDGKYVISGSADKTVKIWKRLSDNWDKWHLEREIAEETALAVEGADFTGVINLSETNKKVFEQRNAKIGEVITKEMGQAADDGQEAILLARNLDKELFAQKLVDIKNKSVSELVKLYSVSGFASKEEHKTSEQKDLPKINPKIKDNPKSELSKAPPIVSEGQSEQKPSNTQKAKTNCCEIFTVSKVKYDNELLNNPDLIRDLSIGLGMSTEKIISTSTYLQELFGSQDFARICDNDTALLLELVGNAFDPDTII